mmetsp:Transcript_33109/g.93716  ORF Transcript_33109/g.93716 Transcript_33109/m.93716 type:complete len:543 (-) Transcript_33109:408-2036(-)
MQHDYPRDLTLEGVREKMEVLTAEDARVRQDEERPGDRVILKLNHNRRATLWGSCMVDPAANSKTTPLGFLMTQPDQKATMPSSSLTYGWASEDTSSLARFTWLAPEPLDPWLVARMMSLPVFKAKVACFWVPGAKVLDCIMLERIANDTHVYYQLLRTPHGQLKEVCFVSSYQQLSSGVCMVGEWAVDHPKCPAQSTSTAREYGMVGYFICGRSEQAVPVDHSAGEIRGVAQVTSSLQEAATMSFLNSFDEFRMSRLGCECELYLQAAMLSKAVLSERVPFLWRWAADVGLWTKGRIKNTKIWRNGRPDTLTRAVRFQGHVPGVHAGTLAQAMVSPEFRRNIAMGSDHSVLLIRTLESLGSYAQVVHVNESMNGKRRDYCVTSCVASVSQDSWVVAEWSVEHPMAPRVKKTTRILLRTVYLLSGQNEDTSLVVCREAVICPNCDCWGTADEVEAELDALPFAFASSMSTLLPSSKGKELLGATPLGLRGQLMHGSGGFLPAIASSLPCMLDCFDVLLQRLTASACCGADQLRIRPARVTAA